MRQKVLDQFDKLPPTIKPLGVYAPVATAGIDTSFPGVWIAETDDPAELHFINVLWAGVIDFEWVPVTVVGTTAHEGALAVDPVQAVQR